MGDLKYWRAQNWLCLLLTSITAHLLTLLKAVTNKILGDRVERAPLNEPVVALTLEYADIDDTRARTADTKKTVGSNQQRLSDI